MTTLCFSQGAIFSSSSRVTLSDIVTGAKANTLRMNCVECRQFNCDRFTSKDLGVSEDEQEEDEKRKKLMQLVYLEKSQFYSVKWTMRR